MKRFSLIFTLLLMAAMPMMAERVTPETAQRVATTFLNNNGTKATQLTDLTKAAGFPNLYIFNAEPGFVVMSADNCVKPILGYSLTGKFVAEGMPENIKGWLQGYSDEIQYAIDNQMRADTETAKLWKDLADGNSKAGKRSIVVDALVQTQWDQDPLYNNYCPYDSNAGELTVTGCVATAMAQIMKYWDYPTSGTDTKSYTPVNHPEYGQQSANFANTTYHWENMPTSLSSSSTTEQINEVARLMYHCGVSVEMEYGISSTGGSGAVTAWVADALETYFRYQPCTFKTKEDNEASWVSMLKTELNEARPLQYSGRGSAGGHSFVCDGYDSDDKFHFNWGWSGHNDGFYALNNLVPGSGGSGGGSYSFTNNQAAIFGIQPQACTASTPANYSASAEGRNAVLSWDAAANAVSYAVYKDDLMVAITTETTYTETNLPYESYTYYVKSRDANGASSAPTSPITVNIEPIATNLTVVKNGSGATLSWTEPEWLAPTTDNEVLTYGDGSCTGGFGAGSAGSMYLYFGHRYPASMLETNKVIYKVSFYASETGVFQLFIYSATAGNSNPQTQIHNQSITASSTGWIDIELSSPIEIDPSKDLWVFIYDPEAKAHPMGYNSTVITDGNYCSWSPNNPINAINTQAVLFLIRTYLTDGTYTYHLYDNGVSVADNIDATSYVVSSPANNTAHQYTVKTKYYGGESAASNTAGLTLGEATLASLSLGANDKLILTEGSQLTITGTISNANAANLVIEDGAQLVHNGGDVEATIQKNISAWSAKGGAGWHLIASPVDEVNIASTLATGTYDLYGYHEPTHHWLNYKKAEHASFFDDLKLRRGKGYLYAHEDAKVVSFAGSMKETDVNVSVPLSWESSNETLKGWNLVGNPYSCNAYSNRAYYVMNAAGNGFVSKTVNDPIPPCTGIFVRATGGGQSVTFSTTAPSSSANNGYLNIALDETNTRGSIRQDNAIVSFNEGEELSKFVFNEENAEVYFTQSNEDYAIAYSDKQGLMSLNFKARHDGTYTLSFTADVISSEAKKSPLNEMFSYLHLIDKRTDSDIDLLAMPSYTFEAKASDNASRFTLVFDESGIASVSAEPFAYVSNGNIIINAATDKASLQMIDVTGRIVVSYTGDAIDHVSTSGMTPGVYVLRLVRGENIKTQKIVIE